jgi:hypothetical protein
VPDDDVQDFASRSFAFACDIVKLYRAIENLVPASIALREARETSYWLRLVTATAPVPAQLVAAQLNEANEFVAMLTTSVKRLRGKRE